MSKFLIGFWYFGAFLAMATFVAVLGLLLGGDTSLIAGDLSDNNIVPADYTPNNSTPQAGRQPSLIGSIEHISGLVKYIFASTILSFFSLAIGYFGFQSNAPD